MAVIFDMQRCGLQDGPGVRTVVFFKGCPLRCAWCHNPEGWDAAPQTLFYPDRCIACGGCAEGCYTGARTLCGVEMTVADVQEIAKKNIAQQNKKTQSICLNRGCFVTYFAPFT